MKNNKFLLNTILAAVVFAACAIALIVRVCAPAAVIPVLNIPNMVALSVIALLLEHFLTKGNPRCYICIPVFALITFGLLPWVAGYVDANGMWKLAIAGAAVFTAVTWLFTTMRDRLSSGPACKAAPLISAMGLYLAAQCLTNIIL